MSLARRCDRCKKFYDNYPKLSDKEQGLEFNTLVLVRSSAIDLTVYDGDKIDLCPNCMAKFIQFMGMR